MSIKTFIGHHGTKLETAQAIVSGATVFAKSENRNDWLGTGVYFWIDNLDRAISWVRNPQRKIKNRAVIQVTIKTKNILDIHNTEHQALIRESYKRLLAETKRYKYKALSNIPNGNGKLVSRYLDCAVLDGVNYDRVRRGDAPFDACVGVFEDGKPIFPGAAIKDKSHIQICVYEPSCITKPLIVWRD